jgi:hypothetical protein
MKLNNHLRLILSDVYVYDIEACHYTILKNMGFDLSNIDPSDKLGRNIEIGKMMRDNPRITSLLRTTTNSLIDDYINENNIKENEIVIRQYDGILLTKKLHTTNIGHIPLDLRKTFDTFISSINRDMYIALDNKNNVTAKGISHLYDEMKEIYKKICKVVEMNKSSRFKHLQRIKDDFFTVDNPNLFGIPIKDKKFNVFLIGYGELEISKSTLKIMDCDDIDRNQYFKHYIEPFTKSIVFESVR